MALTTCPAQEDMGELESSIHEEVVDSRLEYAQKVVKMLESEGIKASPLQYGDTKGKASTILLRENDYVISSTYRVQPYRTSMPKPGDEEKVLVKPFNDTVISSLVETNTTCLVVDGKPETPVEVIEDCLSKLKSN